MIKKSRLLKNFRDFTLKIRVCGNKFLILFAEACHLELILTESFFLCFSIFIFPFFELLLSEKSLEMIVFHSFLLMFYLES